MSEIIGETSDKVGRGEGGSGVGSPLLLPLCFLPNSLCWLTLRLHYLGIPPLKLAMSLAAKFDDLCTPNSMISRSHE